MKGLAIFLDGMFNTLNNNTSVWRLKLPTFESSDQRVYYSQGVGTRRGEVPPSLFPRVRERADESVPC